MNAPPAPIIDWPASPAALQPGDGEIHVWAAPLNLEPETLQRFAATLSSDERERAAKFKFGYLRDRFIAGRGILRAILAPCLDVRPAEVTLETGRQGKPELAETFASAGTHFNLAHSDDLALFAVTRVGPVGVDVEKIRPVRDADDLVARFFSTRENESFQTLPPDIKPIAFFNLWTRKEALLKATGEGITRSLNQVEVSFLPDSPAQLLAIAGDAEQAARWELHAMTPAAGFVGALAIQARGFRVHCWKWARGAGL